MMYMQLEQRHREYAREMQLQREWYDGQFKTQMNRDQQAREENILRQVEREDKRDIMVTRMGCKKRTV